MTWDSVKEARSRVFSNCQEGGAGWSMNGTVESRGWRRDEIFFEPQLTKRKVYI